MKSNFKTYLWTSINVIAGILTGSIVVVFFCYKQGFNSGLLLLWSFGYLVAGAILGFIFSVPKIISGNPGPQPEASLDSTSIKRTIEQNNNLTQVSDWLTKVLIGAGLVELKEIPGFVLHVAEVMGEGVRSVSTKLPAHDSATLISAAVILYFTCWGFISGYVVMKLVLTNQFADSNIG